MSRLIDVNSESYKMGVCTGCPHLVHVPYQPFNMCDTGRAGGQVMACRSQLRAIKFGRQPSGRVRQKPLQRRFRVHTSAPDAWAEKRKMLTNLGKEVGVVWVGSLSRQKQAMVRKFVKSGKLAAYFIPNATVRSLPVMYIRIEDFSKIYRSWNEYTNRLEV